MEKSGTRPAPHRIGGYDVSKLSNPKDKCTDFRGAMRDSAEEKDTQPNIPQIDIDEEFYNELDALMFLQIKADEIGLTEKEKTKLGDEIFRRTKILISQGKDKTIEFLNRAFETNYNYESLQNCLPYNLQREYRNFSEDEYDRFKELSVEDKIEYLKDYWLESDLSDDKLYIALVLLGDIISREQGR